MPSTSPDYDRMNDVRKNAAVLEALPGTYDQLADRLPGCRDLADRLVDLIQSGAASSTVLHDERVYRVRRSA